MSYHYGLNGNDINWDFIEFADQTCVDCDNYLEDLRKLNPEHDVETCEDENCELCAWEHGEWYCEGHTTRYTDSFQTFVLYHDTNSNFVTVQQLTDIPNMTMYRDDYLIDMFLSGDADEVMDEAVRKEMQERGIEIQMGV